MPTSREVLIVEDDLEIRTSVSDFLTAKGFTPVEAGTVAEASARFGRRRPPVAIVDHTLPDGTALELLPKLKEIDPLVSVVVLTGFGTIELAVKAVKAGADQFLTKPVELSVLGSVLERICEDHRNRQKQRAGRRRQLRRDVQPFVGTSKAIRELARVAERVADATSPVLILGETGVGKTLLALWLHRHSARSEEAFLDLNCAGLTRELIETELFGHERGAFTGATTAKEGLFEIAHRGTLFLDEIGDVALEVQPKLLKALEEGRFRRLGDVRDRYADVRLIAATHQDLSRAVKDGSFREDLYFRINTVPLHVPPLRDRREDIRPLAERILAELTATLGRRNARLTDAAHDKLSSADWPGNVRELRNVLERALLLTDRDDLGPDELYFERHPAVTELKYDEGTTLAELEELHIRRALAASEGNVTSAASRLGIPRSTLYQKLKLYGIPTRGRR